MAAGAAADPIRIAILGTGRMARAITEAAAGQADFEIAALVGPQAPDWDTGVAWHARLGELASAPDLLIDFSLPAGTDAAADWCGDREIPLLSGVTGLPDGVRAKLARAAQRVPVLWSANLSLGVNLLAELAGRAAAVVDVAAPVVIDDLHHQWKKDAPSGTALMLGSVIATVRDGDSSGIDYHSRREGEFIGEHTVTFHLAGEEISLVHRAHDRAIYALGALQAGRWLVSQPAGLYAARDWLAQR
jgi:4-hydroxy-tetrahydrodipicolinate reductase